MGYCGAGLGCVNGMEVSDAACPLEKWASFNLVVGRKVMRRFACDLHKINDTDWHKAVDDKGEKKLGLTLGFQLW